MSTVAYSSSKCAADSQRSRQLGNEAYAIGQLHAALDRYEESIWSAPAQSESAALAYGNRSATLYRMAEEEKRNWLPPTPGPAATGRQSHFDAAARDADRAAAAHPQPVPEHLAAKWAQRKRTAAEAAQRVADDDGCTGGTSTGTGGEEALYKGASRQHPNMSSAVRVAYSRQSGRYLVADDDVPPGALVIKEAPFVSLLYAKYASALCSFCFQPLPPDAVPCSRCSDRQMRYCGERCEGRACAQHRFECATLGPESRGANLAGKLLMAVRAMAQCHVDDIVDCDMEGTPPSNYGVSPPQPADDCKHSGGNNGQKEADVYSSRSLNTLLGLVPTSPDDQKQYDWRMLANKAASLMEMKQYLADGTGWPEKMHVSDRRAIVQRTALRVLLRLKANSHGVLRFDVAPPATQQQQQRDHNGNVAHTGDTDTMSMGDRYCGSALYPTASLMNHCCVANLCQVFVGSEIQVRTMCAVQRGESLSTSYGTHYGHSRHGEREAFLKRGFGFSPCACRVCADEAMARAELRLDAFRCVRCKASAADAAVVVPLDADTLSPCGQCKRAPKYAPQCALAAEQRLAGMVASANQAAAASTAYADALIDATGELARYLHRDNGRLNKLRVSAANALMAQKPAAASVLYKSAMESYERMSAGHTIYYASVLSRLADCYIRCGGEKHAAKRAAALRQLWQLLGALFGADMRYHWLHYMAPQLVSKPERIYQTMRHAVHSADGSAACDGAIGQRGAAAQSTVKFVI